MVSPCDRQASLDIRSVPLCYEHGLEIARVYTDRIMADVRMETARRTTLRREAIQIRRGNRAGSVVYYARIGDYVKIGYSARLRNRMSNLRVDELLACEPGGEELERQRHEEFAAERISRRRENFTLSERLVAHIEQVRSEHGLPLWASTPDTTRVVVRRIGEPK